MFVKSESVIQEDDEEEDEDEAGVSSATPSPRTPIAGHVSSVRAEEKRKQIVSTVKDAANKHINPRTGQIQHGIPSRMGHEVDTPKPMHEQTMSTEQIQMNPVETRRENVNGNEYVTRRSTKLVDVGSQTSNESQKQLEAGASAYVSNSQPLPTIIHTPASTSANTRAQNTQTYISRANSTSRGLISAFNSLAPITVQETTQTLLQPVQMPIDNGQLQRERSQPRQMYQSHRHNTTGLTKQPISRSANNFSNSLINDSGYGSLDKLRPNDHNTILASPILSKRPIIQSKVHSPNGNAINNDRIQINGLSHSQNESSTPFHSDSGGDNSPRGSNGFVNYTGITSSTPTISGNIGHHILPSMKGTAYDRIHYNQYLNKK